MKNSHNIRCKQLASRKWIATLSMVGCMLFTPGAHGQSKKIGQGQATDALHQLNDSVEALIRRVSPSIVQIQVSGFASTEEATQGQTSVIVGKQRTIGSGVIVDPDGYIVTNAHVVKGAQRIEVIVPPPPISDKDKDSDSAQNGREHVYDARVVGVTTRLDLAVIKIEAHALPCVPIRGNLRPRQGEMVFAFGSPEGLRNSVTMGVVSAVDRQPDPDSPLVYVQTDTPINPGNSGGPLVNADGDLIGINTFILSSSGGNQGLGFAIPAGVIAYAYPQLVKYGHIHQPEIGAILQTITPEISAGLHLPRDFGVIVSDVMPNGPADHAGLKVQDIIVRVDDMRTENLPLFGQSLYMHGTGDHVKVEVLRGSSRMQLDVSLGERPHKVDSLVDTVDPVNNLVPRLGIIGVELNVDLAHSLPELRIPSGIVVAAKTVGPVSGEIPLQTGDVIHGLNGAPVTTLSDLRERMGKFAPGDPVVMWIERFGQLIYVSFVM
ncbi:MAG TPA: trypsin-like peptidase domain-containing protein [Candidatus Acidoferrales bacterium]|nr:trypsin-like peptidase domain-containing protein [Candidatus Acidoferrales bacterium]